MYKITECSIRIRNNIVILKYINRNGEKHFILFCTNVPLSFLHS